MVYEIVYVAILKQPQADVLKELGVCTLPFAIKIIR